MKHRKALTTILGVVIAVAFYLFYVIDIGRELEDEVLIPALLIGMLLIWGNFVAGECSRCVCKSSYRQCEKRTAAGA